MAEKRQYGSGSITRRPDGSWLGRVDITPARPGQARRRKSFVSKDRAVVEAKMAAWFEVNPPQRIGAEVPKGDRRAYLADAQVIGTHTQEEMDALWDEAGGLCYYCERDLLRLPNRDHKTPLSRGGSDSIDNIVITCWDCNEAKRSMTEPEFRAWAAKGKFFTRERKPQIFLLGRVWRFPNKAAARHFRAAAGLPQPKRTEQAGAA